MENLMPGLWYKVYLDGDASKAVVDVRRLATLLPHGSGLDGDWYLTVRRNGDVGLAVEYHSMDKNGGYAGWRDLRASVVKVRKDELHPLTTPGFAQVLHRKGDIILRTARNGDAGEWFHECLAADIKDLLTQGTGLTIETATGRLATWDRELGEWRVIG